MGQSGLAARKLKKQIDGINVTRIGMMKDHRAVYYFKDIGYWICPPYITLYNNKDTLRVGYLETNQKRVSWTVEYYTRLNLTNALSYAVRQCKDAGFLFSRPVDRTFFQPRRVRRDMKSYSLRVPLALRESTGTTCISVCRGNVEPLSKFEERVIERHAVLTTRFRSLYSISIEEALTIYPNNPILYEL